jgi:hypothetical protein
MSAGDTLQGRRRPDTRLGDMPDPWPEPGDYWRPTHDDGRPLTSDEPGNLTGTVWMFCAPNGAIGTLTMHTVREHDDGTITVAAGDGSSNSILITGGGTSWHGYIARGMWSEV